MDQRAGHDSRIERHAESGLRLIAVRRPDGVEWHLTATPLPGENPAGLFGRVGRVLRERSAVVVKQDVFGAPAGYAAGRAAMEQALGELDWPVTWIEGADCEGRPVAGVQIVAVTGVPVRSLRQGDKVVGRVFENHAARYCLLGDIGPSDRSADRADQAASAFDNLLAALDEVGMSLSNVVRTWLYLDRILAWYADLNAVRNRLFTAKGVYDGVVPASTGVHGRNPAGTALAMSALALRARADAVRVQALPSPLQCPALEYGSSFSRAVEVATPTDRRVFVSGTASIEPSGRTAHVGDAAAQVALTMRVVEAILASRSLTYRDVHRAVAYMKHARDASVFRDYCADRDLADLPVIVTQSDICRDDLLFEIEVDAMAV